MQSRMDRYDVNEKRKYERSRKNTKLYEEIYDDMYKDISYKNMEIIDSAKEINISKLKNILDDKYDTRQYRTFKNYDNDDDNTKENIEKRKVYDINQIINEAKNKRAFIEEAKEKKKYMDFTHFRKNQIDDLKEEEKELEDLINTVTLVDDESSDALDLLSDLKGNENTIVTNAIKQEENNDEEEKDYLEKTIVKADKTFYTDSNMFTKNDFEDFTTLQNSIIKSSNKRKEFIIFIISVILLVIGYFIYVKYFIK